MAADAIDAAAQYVPARVATSITEKVPLLGADGYFALINQTEHVGAIAGLHPYRVRHLLDRYGSLLNEVLGLAADRRDLLNPIAAAPGYLRVEAAYAAAAEGALHLEDILARRTRIAIEYSHRGVDCAREVADIVAPILGWSAADVDREVEDLHGPSRGRGAVPDPARRRVRRCAAGQRSGGAGGDPRAGAAELKPAPLPPRDGFGPARLRVRGGPFGEELTSRFGPEVAAKAVAGEVVDQHGAVLDPRPCCRPGAVVYLYRELRDEVRGAVRHPGAVPATRTSWSPTSRISWPPCRVGGTSCRRRWFGCGDNSGSTS